MLLLFPPLSQWGEGRLLRVHRGVCSTTGGSLLSDLHLNQASPWPVTTLTIMALSSGDVFSITTRIHPQTLLQMGKLRQGVRVWGLSVRPSAGPLTEAELQLESKLSLGPLTTEGLPPGPRSPWRLQPSSQAADRTQPRGQDRKDCSTQQTLPGRVLGGSTEL